MLALTPRQRSVLGVIRKSFAERGMSPTYDEIADALELKSRSMAHKFVHGLESRGAVRVHAHRRRGIEIVDVTPADLAKILRPAQLRALDAYSKQSRLKPEAIIREAIDAYLGVG
jgi:SOS-response transcriptional repressor LexA